MPLPSPNLDDRSFEQLLEEAKTLVARSDCGWTDLSAGDPGAVLLEAFAYLTSMMLYRLNRLPEKVHVELLRLVFAAPALRKPDRRRVIAMMCGVSGSCFAGSTDQEPGRGVNYRLPVDFFENGSTRRFGSSSGLEHLDR